MTVACIHAGGSEFRRTDSEAPSEYLGEVVGVFEAAHAGNILHRKIGGRGQQLCRAVETSVEDEFSRGNAFMRREHAREMRAAETGEPRQLVDRQRQMQMRTDIV